MEAIAVRVSGKYQIVIPRAVREALQLRPDDMLLFLVSGDSVILRTRPASFAEAMRGLHKEIWPAEPADWLEKERATWEERSSGRRSAPIISCWWTRPFSPTTCRTIPGMPH